MSNMTKLLYVVSRWLVAMNHLENPIAIFNKPWEGSAVNAEMAFVTTCH